MLAAVRAELTKILTLRITWMVTGGILALHLLVNVANLGHFSTAVAGITPGGLIELFAGRPRPAHRAIVDLQVAINRYIDEHNDEPKPFTWTKTPVQILAKLNPLNAPVH